MNPRVRAVTEYDYTFNEALHKIGLVLHKKWADEYQNYKKKTNSLKFY